MNANKKERCAKTRNTFREMMFVALVINAITLMLLAATLIFMMITLNLYKKIDTIQTPNVEQTVQEASKPEEPPVEELPQPVTEEVVQPEVVVYPATDEEIELLALVTMAEAEGESEEGKRLVIDTVLNRVDSPRWPNTIRDVIYQPSQFTSMWNGRANRCKVTEEVRQLVKEELLSRTNSEVVYFTAGGYGRYGRPSLQVGNHYFCTL